MVTAAESARQSRGRTIAMTAEERDAFLSEQRTCRVATNGADGAPHQSPLWYAWDGEAIWLNSIVKSRRWNDLVRDPRVSVIVDAGEDFTELRGVELMGTVEVVGEVPRTGAEVPELVEPERLFGARYAAGQFRPDGRHAWLRLVPSRIVSWDFRKRHAPAAVPTGPLGGVKVIEVAGLGAAPYTAMLLSDLGADVIRVDRPGAKSAGAERYALSRGRRSVTIDMKKSGGVDTFLSLVDRADVLLEGFRPGVAERLGYGPDVCLARNPRLVFARMTGWGRTGPLSQTAGHDLNYLGLTGALTLLQRSRHEQPATPPGFVADFGGGGLMLAFGIVCALLETRTSGRGQVVDGSMVDGVASLTTLIYAMTAQGRWKDEPGTNFSDGGAPYYDSYRTSDGKFLAVAPIEPQFYRVMVEKLGLDLDELPDRDDPANWPALKKLFTDVFARRTRDEWAAVFAGTDACVTPVLTFTEAREHPHNQHRETFVEAFDVLQPAPAPRFGRTPGAIAGPPPVPGAHSAQVLTDWGFAPDAVDVLLGSGAIIQARPEA
ncbi:CoA transferase [Cryptosporangium sp. NPDC051539]|uniref:CoA transferase n=1 Tax=Cryptosporangium sp. NPDC051539 TaxID=3363962 RepID=UPI0037A1EEA7